ncbi:cobyric acid synthase [Mycobacteroides saopaulense]|uniref:Cobyric acid synthase n=1 Tax=Mycobacteroides saopaulense TaxID=1578165 RepID=A0A1X0J799_9MYCO|nr:cobyric acid synthase [Mycobacteroides saopaulense]OHT88141.1 cobyric acid synthase CobQ [Mycobacteroides saopaulense]OHU06482.1 cobyric acid synthase CobQ [Mycobacteroides saopaulense]ORB57955.1 cobyric acid synthase CobQ [Mycobacteroides saopaulense]
MTGAVSGALLVGGVSSDAGKSLVVTGLCRLLSRRGIRVAPFKAQNMSNNSVVTIDGGEIGRAQALQARACGLEPSVRFNPVLLKPGSDRTSQLVVRGHATGNVSARSYVEHREELRQVVAEELRSLREEYDVVICEGAGSVAEINLRSTDIANMGLAQAADLPVILVGDIDRGGVLAHLFGSVAVLEPADQRLVAGFIVNKFRGDPALLRPGLEQLAALTGRTTYGVLPYDDQLWLDAEDSVSVVASAQVGRPAAPIGREWLRVAAVRLPRISNSTDIEAIACEPGVIVRWAAHPADIADADVVVLPGTKATVADLDWLRNSGIADAVVAHARSGGPVLGICGGFQMLATTIDDRVESGVGIVQGLGLLDIDIAFAPVKTLRRWVSPGLNGYEIHHGTVTRSAVPHWLTDHDEGAVAGAVWGTHWHGVLDNDDFRRAWLTEAAAASGRSGFIVAADTNVGDRRVAQLDKLADLIETHVDVDALHAVWEPRGRGGRAARYPVITAQPVIAARVE